MTTEEKCKAIIEKITELCNEGKPVGFESDFGDNTLTILVDHSHTHVGVPDGNFDTMVDHLYDSLHSGPGLSWA